MGSMNYESEMFSQYRPKEEIVIKIWPRRRLGGAEESFFNVDSRIFKSKWSLLERRSWTEIELGVKILEFESSHKWKEMGEGDV